MRGYTKQFRPADKLPFNKAQKSFLFGIAPAFLVAFLATFFASSILAPVNMSDAANLVSANVSYEGFYVKMSTSDVPMELLTTTTGSMTVVSSTVKAATNSPAGYELYLGISPDDSAGVEKESADKQKNGLYLDGDLSRTDGAVFSAAPGTGGKTGTPSALSNNTWGYAVDKNTTGAPTIWTNENHTTMTSATPTDDKFAAVPTYGSEDLIQETTTPNVEIDTAESDVQENDYTTATLYYGIRGDMSKIAGSYSNTIAYTAVAKTPSVTSNITFSPASYTHAGGTPWTDTLTIMTQLYTEASDLGSATVTFSGGPQSVSNLSCANPTVSTVDSLLRITCTLPEAAPGTYDVQVFLNKFDQTFTGTYTYEDEPTMQSQTYINQCKNAATGTTFTLKDSRDDNEYQVRKLADGNCWMVQNLRLTGRNAVFTQEDSNVSTSGFSMTTSASNTGTWCNAGIQSCDNKAQYLDTGSVSYGVYYNWYAATAGFGTYSVSSSTSPYDICPKGWKLPTSNSSADQWQTLVNSYAGSTDTETSANMRSSTGPALVLSGRRDAGKNTRQGENGHYWSSTAYHDTFNAYHMVISLLSANPTTAHLRSYGYTVRCVAK